MPNPARKPKPKLSPTPSVVPLSFERLSLRPPRPVCASCGTKTVANCPLCGSLDCCLKCCAESQR